MCVDYDLCDRCHIAGVHDKHQMLKIERPDDALAVQSPGGALAFDPPPGPEQNALCDGCAVRMLLL